MTTIERPTCGEFLLKHALTASDLHTLHSLAIGAIDGHARDATIPDAERLSGIVEILANLDKAESIYRAQPQTLSTALREKFSAKATPKETL